LRKKSNQISGYKGIPTSLLTSDIDSRFLPYRPVPLFSGLEREEKEERGPERAPRPVGTYSPKKIDCEAAP